MKKTIALLMAIMMLTGMISSVFAEGDSEIIDAPAPVVEEQPAPEPAPAVKEEPAPAPAPVVKEEPAPAPAPVVKEEPAPAPAPEVKEEPAPAPAPEVKEEPVPAPVVEEKPAEQPAEEAPAAEEKADPAPVEEAPAPAAEEKPAEQPAEEAPAPAAEEPAAPAEETVPAEEPAEVPAEEIPAEPVEEVPAPAEEVPAEQPEAPAQEVVIEQKEVFTGRLDLEVVNVGPIYDGDEVVLKAKVQNANLDYSVRWETFDTTSTDLNETWKTVASGEKFTFKANAAATLLLYRAHLVAEDGTELYTAEFFFTLSVKAEPAKEPAEEVVPAEEAPAADKPVEEVPAAEEPVTEEPAEEPVESEETPAAPVEETPAAEEPAEEVPAAEEPAEEAPEAVPAVEEPAEEPEIIVVEEKAPEAAAEEEKPAETTSEEEVILLDIRPETEDSEEIEEYETPMGLTEPQTISIEGEVEVNVREGADGLAAIFETLPEGAEVTVVNVDGDWATVVVNDELGYIYIDDIAEYLDLEEEDEESEEVSEETVEETAEEVVETPKKVTIFTSRRRVMEAGEPVYLTSKLEGFEDCEEIMYVWYVDKGNGFEVVEGANEDTYTFTANAESLSWGWKLNVLYR